MEQHHHQIDHSNERTMVFFQRGRFRNSRGGLSRMLNLCVAAGVGVVSGHYIFKEPLEEYWAEQGRLASSGEESSTSPAAGGGGGGSLSSAASAAAAPASKNS